MMIGTVLATITFLGTMFSLFIPRFPPERMKMLVYLSSYAELLSAKVHLLVETMNRFAEKLFSVGKIPNVSFIDVFDRVDKLQRSINTSNDSIQNKLKTQSSWDCFFGLPRKWKLAMLVKDYLNEVEELENKYKDLAKDEDLITEASEMGVILNSNERNANSLKEKETELKILKKRVNQYLVSSLPEDWFPQVYSFLKSSSKTYEEYRSKPKKCKKGLCPRENCQSCKDLYTIGKEIAESLLTAERLQKEANKCLVAFENTVDVGFIPISSSKVVGQDEKLQEVLDLIKENGSVAIWGMGGVGKTTLLSRINNHYVGKNVGSAGFDIVIFVTAGRGACISRVQADIGKRLRISGLSESGNIKEQEREISKSLRSKNCLLLVDDVWEKIEPNILGMLVEDGNNYKRNVVVITTRDASLLQCRQKKTVEVELLSAELSWELFRNHVDNDELLPLGDGELISLARKIVEECGGLPLALRTVGRSLCHARTKFEWRVARKKLENSAHTFEAMVNKVLVPLKFSFEHLKDDDMHNILFFCMCHREITISDLLENLLWESVKDVDDESHFKDRCLIHIINLVQKGLLMCSKRVEEIGSSLVESVSLHVCVRDMLAWLIDSDKDNYLEMVSYHYNRSEENKQRYLPHTEKWERAGRIYMTRFPWREFPQEVNTPNCKKLFSFVFRQNKLFRLPVRFFCCMQSLRLLDLSDSSFLEELPESIRFLINLRCLKLSLCPHLKKLPKEMQHLKQLVYLFLNGTRKLKDIPRECFSELYKLQQLDLRDSAFGWTWDSDELLASLHDIRKLMEDGVLRKAEFDLKVDEEGILKFLVDSPRLLRCIRKLTVDFRNFKEVKEEISLLIKNMSKMESLVDLTLKCIPEDSVLDFDGLSPPNFLPLECLTIEDCPKLNRIANKSWKFPKLESVIIKNCPELMDVPFSRENAPMIQHISGVPDIPEWIFNETMMRIVGKESMLIKQEDVKDWIFFLKKKERHTKFMEKKVKTLDRSIPRFPCSEKWLERVNSFIRGTSELRKYFRRRYYSNENAEDFVCKKGIQLLQFYQEVAAHHKGLMEEGRMQLESRDEMLRIEPFEIRFPFELHKKASCSLQLSNNRDTKIKFHVQPPKTIRNQYCIWPDSGTMEPRSTIEVVVTLEALMVVPIDLLQCNDKFIVESNIVDNDDQPSAITEEEKHIYMLPVTYDATCLNICDSYYGIVLDQLLKYHGFLNDGVHDFTEVFLNDGVHDFTEVHFPFGVVDCWAFIKVLVENDPQLKMLAKVETLRLDFRNLGEGKENITLLTKEVINLLTEIMVNMKLLYILKLEYIQDQHFHLLFQGSFPPKIQVVISHACGGILFNLPSVNYLSIEHCENLATLLLSRSEDISPITCLCITDCPKLNSIAIQSCKFPMLGNVHIDRCPELKKVPFTRQNAPNLRRIKLNERDVWFDPK